MLVCSLGEGFGVKLKMVVLMFEDFFFFYDYVLVKRVRSFCVLVFSCGSIIFVSVLKVYIVWVVLD